jgi:hypothetical protein
MLLRVESHGKMCEFHLKTEIAHDLDQLLPGAHVHQELRQMLAMRGENMHRSGECRVS